MPGERRNGISLERNRARQGDTEAHTDQKE